MGELRGAKAELLVWSARAKEDRSYEFHCELGSPACSLDGGGVLERGSEEKAKGRGERVAGVLVVLLRARNRALGLCLGRATATARWRPAGARCCVARQGGTARRQKAVEEVGRDAWAAIASRRWPGWPSTAATALNSGGEEQSRQAGWRKGKRDQFAISEISGTQL